MDFDTVESITPSILTLIPNLDELSCDLLEIVRPQRRLEHFLASVKAHFNIWGDQGNCVACVIVELQTNHTVLHYASGTDASLIMKLHGHH